MRCAIVIALVLLTGSSPSFAQPASSALQEGFQFVRIRYESNSGRSRNWGGRGPWAYDWPTAEKNLHMAIERTTDIPLAGAPIVLTFQDEEIFQHPILYLCEPGYWYLPEEEIETIRKYLDRGGFIIIDDFHDNGDGVTGWQWDNFYMNLKQIFPDKEPVELEDSHPIWNIFYSIDPLTARSTKLQSGEVPWLDDDDDVYYAIYDDTGRMVMVICYNQDIGDGWEWPERNMGDASTVSFQMAINFIMYALSH